jgi:hypothetical protein
MGRISRARPARPQNSEYRAGRGRRFLIRSPATTGEQRASIIPPLRFQRCREFQFVTCSFTLII